MTFNKFFSYFSLVILFETISIQAQCLKDDTLVKLMIKENLNKQLSIEEKEGHYIQTFGASYETVNRNTNIARAIYRAIQQSCANRKVELLNPDDLIKRLEKTTPSTTDFIRYDFGLIRVMFSLGGTTKICKYEIKIKELEVKETAECPVSAWVRIVGRFPKEEIKNCFELAPAPEEKLSEYITDVMTKAEEVLKSVESRNILSIKNLITEQTYTVKRIRIDQAIFGDAFKLISDESPHPIEAFYLGNGIYIAKFLTNEKPIISKDGDEGLFGYHIDRDSYERRNSFFEKYNYQPPQHELECLLVADYQNKLKRINNTK